jgi:hypothetical protein
MVKLYRNAAHPNSWVAYIKETGWVIFPARENGWEERRPARGLDPIRLREVPLDLAANTGILDAHALQLS